MSETMKVAIMNTIGKLEFEQKPIPQVKDDDVLIRLDYVGICGSDMHLFENGYIGEKHVTEPIVLGHEPGGVVEAVGKNVTSLKPGDRVAVEPGIPCYTCDYCKAGRYNLCPKVYFYASLPVVEGCFAEYISHPANLCFKLPDNVSTLEGALMEPLAVGMHAALQSGAQVGASAVILGAGAIGLLTMLSLKSMGVHNITVVDLVQNRLEKAKQLGCTHTVNASEGNAIDAVMSISDGEGADYVFETAGSEVTILQTAKMVKRGGTIVLVGYTSSGKAQIHVNNIIDNEITVKTVFRYRNIYPKAIEAVSKGIIPLKEIVSDIFEFDRIQEAMEKSIQHKDKVTKCVIRIR
ncbi:NAD(P)-dependent alcohol dehydrogenase [Paenibacillus sp. 32O-W]|uniref:NAD(P)-dependent alcohol dehydrogenase n=1 Tax=Paenibacillus sp. 32O-W TaxID=1695218 RepID=UPI0011A828EB|nr:NAD(P)-dependent alcohol dehydrogenase [Paenibacillus sp. 32O-W]